jgi:hypothetical protein
MGEGVKPEIDRYRYAHGGVGRIYFTYLSGASLPFCTLHCVTVHTDDTTAQPEDFCRCVAARRAVQENDATSSRIKRPVAARSAVCNS